jgi:hypothetical protein
MATVRMKRIVTVGLLLVSCGAAQGQGLKGEYFPNRTLSGQPTLTRTENVGFNWLASSPGDPIGVDNFSVRWTGSLTPPESGSYTFSMRSDDGVRLWVGGSLVVDNWGDHSAVVNAGKPVLLDQGDPVSIKVEYYENGGDAVCEWYWSGPGIPNQIVPANFLSTAIVPSVKARLPIPISGTLNQPFPLLQWSPGDGAFFHNVYLGTSPNLTEADQKSFHQYGISYYHIPGLTPGATYYWRVDEVEKDAVTTHTGSVWTFTMQAMTAYYPSPADGATDAPVAPTLAWQLGMGATKHQVYLGDSLDAVKQGVAATDKGTLTVPDAAFAPGTLESLTTYYWRVDAIVPGRPAQTGTVWSFTTCLPVDGFDSYTDEAGNCIFETWIDGLVNNNGAMVGYKDPPYAEPTIIHNGTQSMPFDYNNTIAPFYSEAVRSFDSAQDWTVGGAGALVLYVTGRVGNAPEPLYVALEDASKHVKAIVHPNAAIAASGKWSQWKILLSDFTGVNPAKIKKIYIGLGNRDTPVKGGAGLIFIDDVCVTKP